METKVKRRYRSDFKQDAKEFAIYDKAFDQFLLDSNILNPATGSISAHTILWNKRTMETALWELEGDEEGNLPNDFGTTTVPSAILAATIRLKEIADKWQNYKERKIKEGYAEPETEPSNLFEDRLVAETRLDVLKREAEKLKEEIGKAKAVETKISNSKMLQYGPLAQGRLQGGTLVEIDFQSVGQVNLTLVITEPASPYRGMKISDYRDSVCTPWCEERHRSRRSAELLFRKEMEDVGFSSIVVPPGLGIRKVARESLPKWPTGVKNYLSEK